ncbi:glutamyl-tRNA(Gln) and/or aspartyl-tRNA(Asn) amidotransferase, A subunit [Desulfitobacterium dichloroeliminans LMG P-21439]|uniref:Glutamyl-tRNA(Gln) amidotransferase subunit A n=1 Tax=Desulfitobacterium dichloroeliminans (strain LMG P-21439 / DCA1) TaxID=871963 RepID=L0F736_DESDL|nr:Asp-tRNA(Asn)/Glu-tRNA(Gln) amidotransferase subunit GatA [Desulfitobacterium dichloroeliminans]AGA68773.1 glutamyl-tRNA(Gln) and/or aspartyl-tRNA(Asn) amidotransferase, A subunit [Desulfitobacterium dichloroeliminans LMG P-21439]
MEITTRTIGELHELLESKAISATELAQGFLARIESVDPEIKAFITVTKKTALEQAKAVDEKLARGEKLGALEGIPMALKDNLCTEGIRTTCSSKILDNFIPPYNATVTDKLKDAGAVLLGKLNMDEFAMGSSTENSGFFATRNPWDLERVPGGSSGGSVAAVAADQAVFTLGSDTGGSIRQPAAFCGVVGLKPTYGLVSRYGLIAYASSLDQIGPVTKTVADNAWVLNAIAGHDAKDSTSVSLAKPDYTRSLTEDIRGLRIGVPQEYFGQGMDPQVETVLREAIRTYESLGAIVEECSLPHTEYAMPAYYLIATAEASSNLARYDGVRYGHRTESPEDILSMFCKTRAEGFGSEVKRRIMLGTYALSAGYYDAYYLKAQKARTLIVRDFDQAFEKYDVLLSPTTPTTAFRIGEKSSDPLTMYLSDVCTVPINLAGIPALSMPAGFVDGLPVGMQLMGKHFAEGTLYKAGYAFEKNTSFHTVKPSLSQGGAK